MEDLWTKHLRIISEEAQDYHAQHGFYPWEEESASGPGDAQAAPGPAPAPGSEPLSQAALQAGKNAGKAQALSAPAAGEVLAGQPTTAPAPLDPVDDGYPAWVSYYPENAEVCSLPKEGPLLEAWGEGLLLGWQAVAEALSGLSDLSQEILIDFVRQNYLTLETTKDIAKAMLDFACGPFTPHLLSQRRLTLIKKICKLRRSLSFPAVAMKRPS